MIFFVLTDNQDDDADDDEGDGRVDVGRVHKVDVIAHHHLKHRKKSLSQMKKEFRKSPSPNYKLEEIPFLIIQCLARGKC